jgi:hypothetical protein
MREEEKEMGDRGVVEMFGGWLVRLAGLAKIHDIAYRFESMPES